MKLKISTPTLDPNQPSTSQQPQQQRIKHSTPINMKSKINLSNYRKQIRKRRKINGAVNNNHDEITDNTMNTENDNQSSNVNDGDSTNKWKKLDLRRCANDNKVDLQKVIFSCSYQYLHNESLKSIKNVLSDDIDYNYGYQIMEKDDIELSSHTKEIIDEFEINSFEDYEDFELFSKIQTLKYVEIMIEKKRQEKLQNKLAKVSYEEPHPDLLNVCHVDPERIEQLSKRKVRQNHTNNIIYHCSLSDEAEASVSNEEKEEDNNVNLTTEQNNQSNNSSDQNLDKTSGPKRTKSSRKRKSQAIDYENDSSNYTDIFTRKSSRGRVIKPKNNDQWYTDMEALDELEKYENCTLSFSPLNNDETSITNGLSSVKHSPSDDDNNNSNDNSDNKSMNRNHSNNSGYSLLSRSPSKHSLLAKPCDSKTKSPLSSKIHNISYKNNSTIDDKTSNDTSIEQSKFTPIVQLEELENDDVLNDENNNNENLYSKFHHNNSKIPNNLQPAKVFSRFTPFGWKSFLKCQNDSTIYEFDYGNLGRDHTVYVDDIKKIIADNNCSNVKNDDSINDDNSKNDKNSKINFAFSQAKFLDRLKQSDNDFCSYESSTPMLLNMLIRENDEQKKKFTEITEEYFNILGRFYNKHYERRFERNWHLNRQRKLILRRCIMKDIEEQYAYYSNKPFDQLNDQYKSDVIKSTYGYSKTQPAMKILQPLSYISSSPSLTTLPALPLTVNKISTLSQPISIQTLSLNSPKPSMTAKVNSFGQLQLIDKNNTSIEMKTHLNKSGTNATTIAKIVSQPPKTYGQHNQLMHGQIPKTKLAQALLSNSNLMKSNVSTNNISVNSTITATMMNKVPVVTNVNSSIAGSSKPVILRAQPLSSSSSSNINNQNVQPKTTTVEQNTNNNNLNGNKIKKEDDDDIILIHEHIPKKATLPLNMRRNTKIFDPRKFLSIIKHLSLYKRRIIMKLLFFTIPIIIYIIKSKENNRNLVIKRNRTRIEFSSDLMDLD